MSLYVALVCRLQVTGEWKGKTAGGCGNYPETNQHNPIYQVTLDSNTASNHLLVELRAPRWVNLGGCVERGSDSWVGEVGAVVSEWILVYVR